MIKLCKNCKKEFNGRTRNKFCSRKCHFDFRRGGPSCLGVGKSHPCWTGGKAKCIDCGKLLSDYKSKRCTKCARINVGKQKFKQVLLKCAVCGSQFYRKKSYVKRVTSLKCCSQKCSGRLTAERQRGSKSHLWKGGKTTLSQLIKTHTEYKQWRLSVFKRDNMTCTKCGISDKTLEPHHKKEFSILLDEFIKEYNQFSPHEDRETLSRLSLSYKPFWDLDNGITLCRKCHMKTESWGVNMRYKT